MPASGWGSLWEWSSFVPRFSTFVFRNVPGTVPECVRICGFKRISSNLDRAPKMRDSVPRNSWDSFLLILPSISSETCVIYSSLILGTDVFRDWPFLGCSSCVSLVTAANFRLFLNFTIFLKGKCWAVIMTQLVFFCESTWGYNKKCYSFENQTSRNQYSQLIIQKIIRISLLVLSFLLFLPFGWREAELFTGQVKVQSREKYFNHNSYKGNMPTLAGNKHFSVHFFFRRRRLYHLSTENIRVRSVGKGYQSFYSRADTINNSINKWSKRFSSEGK